ncbi:MAG: gamma-glutamyltransferase [Thermodesulfobacteriota bacterium]
MKGVIVGGHELTVSAGAAMLARGGNAFDAAVAAAFASCVAESALTSVGGGGFMAAHTAGGANMVYDFFTTMPGLGSVDKGELDFFPLHIDFADALQTVYIGRGAAAVPGFVAGLEEVRKNHCRLPVDVLLEPAITMAREGFPVNAAQAYFNTLLEPMLRSSREPMDVYMPQRRAIAEGGIIKHESMARAFESLVRDGLGSFYTGHVAEGLLRGFGAKEGGLITEEDLAVYRPVVRKPVELAYRGRTVYTNPPPSSGGALIAFALKLLEHMDVAGPGHNTALYMRRLAYVMKVTDEARRASFDHNLFDAGLLERFLSDAHLSGFRERLAEQSDGPGHDAAGAAPRPLGDTTHISVADAEGNLVSITTSVGMGCGFMIPGTGIMMNNMLGEHDLNPHGFHTMTPGRRLSSMMAPTIVMRDKAGEIVLGSGGSKRIRSAVLQTILNVIDFEMPVDKAVNVSRIHFENGVLDVEDGVPGHEIEALRATGIKVKRWKKKDMYFGGVHSIVREEGGLTGSGDRRRGGAVKDFSPSTPGEENNQD